MLIRANLWVKWKLPRPDTRQDSRGRTKGTELRFSFDRNCLKKSASKLHVCSSQQKISDYNVINWWQIRWQVPKAREYLAFNITLNWGKSLVGSALLLIGQFVSVMLSPRSISNGVFLKLVTNDWERAALQELFHELFLLKCRKVAGKDYIFGFVMRRSTNWYKVFGGNRRE